MPKFKKMARWRLSARRCPVPPNPFVRNVHGVRFMMPRVPVVLPNVQRQWKLVLSEIEQK